MPRIPAYRSLRASSRKIPFTSSTSVSRAVTMTISATDPAGTGARTAVPSNLPRYSGNARAVATAAPVVDGTRFSAPARPRRFFLFGPSTMDWLAV